MMKCKFAFVFVIVLAVYLQQSQASPVHDVKDDKLSPVAVKAGVAKAVATKVKLAALKKLALIKAVVKAPFLLGKKAILLKIGAVKGLAALKAAKAKKVLGLASKKVAPAVAAVSVIPAAVAAIPAAVASLPAAAAAALKPTEVSKTEVVDIYSIPISETHYQVAKPNAHYSSSIVSSYNDESGTPNSYSNGYSVSLNSAGEIANTYQYYTVPSDNHGIVEKHETEGKNVIKVEDTDTEVIAPHQTYGVPN